MNRKPHYMAGKNTTIEMKTLTFKIPKNTSA